MTKNEFLQRFQFNTLAQSSHKYQYKINHHQGELKNAAVLIALIDQGDHIDVLLTQRASNMRHHGGQICFVGGKVDECDDNLISTATREAYEEIALLPQQCKIIGSLHSYQTISGFLVNPIVAFIPAKIQLRANKTEVQDIFKVPLEYFIDPKNTKSIWVQMQNQHYPIYFMPYNQYNIWGATAAILKDLSDHIR